MSVALLAESHDGTRVPVTVLHAKDAVLDGSAPMLLYGYGAYGFAMSSAFSPHVYSLVDRGFVYAIAHIRGGTENGYGWYLDGKLDRKKNTFLDFIVVAEYLIAENFTSASQIVAQGRSAGGMLMGAWQICARICSPASWSRCRSSTSSIPCATRPSADPARVG